MARAEASTTYGQQSVCTHMIRAAVAAAVAVTAVTGVTAAAAAGKH